MKNWKSYLDSWIGGTKKGLLFFCALARLIAPWSNIAKVFHASCKNRDKMGVTLLESCMLDIRDILHLELEIQNFKKDRVWVASVQISNSFKKEKYKGFWRQEKNLEKKLKST